MEVDLLEDGEGPADEDGPLHVAPGHVERLDLLLGAHHRRVALLVVVELRDGGDADLVVLEPHAAVLEERVPVDPGGVLDEKATLGHAAKGRNLSRLAETDVIFHI